MEEFRGKRKGREVPARPDNTVGKRGLAPFLACQREPTKPADNRGVEAEIIPPAGVVDFIDADVVLEDAEY